MSFSLSKTISRIFPLPPPENRRGGIVPARWLHYALRLDRDADYICYQLLNLVLLAGVALVAAILLDAHLGTGLLVDADEFQQNKLLLPVTFSRLIGLPVLALTVLFYLRIRLTIDICRDDIVILTHKTLLLTTSRRRWVGRSLLLIFVGLFGVFMSHIVVIQITLHYEMQDSLGFILLPQAFAVGAVAASAMFIASYGLVLEKTLRCFPALESNLERIDQYIRENKSRTT